MPTPTVYWIQECHYEQGVIAAVRVSLAGAPQHVVTLSVEAVLLNMRVRNARYYTARVFSLVEGWRQGALVEETSDGMHITTDGNHHEWDNLANLPRF